MTDTLTSTIPEIVKLVENNPLIVTLTSGGAIVWLFANLKNAWSLLVSAIKALVSFEITNTYEDTRGTGVNPLRFRQIEFNNILIESKAIWERVVNLDLSNNISIKDFDKEPEMTECYDHSMSLNDTVLNVKSATVNAYGFSIRILCGKLVAVNRSYKLDGQRITMNTTIRVFFANKKRYMKRLDALINSKVKSTILMNSTHSQLHVFNGETFCGMKLKRSIDSIFTKNGKHKELLDSIKNFIANKETYKKLNYPYNYCGLLYGVPGSGKTSTILAIASELNRDVYYISMANATTTTILKALNDNPSECIYVFEDIDAASYRNAENREKDAETDNASNENSTVNDISKAFTVSLSDLLNITDGLLASDGTICLFTTNHIEKLDPAFLRAGRMNKTVEFTYMSPDVSKKMVETYLDVSLDNMMDNIKPAELQECILDILLKKKTIEDLKEKFCVK